MGFQDDQQESGGGTFAPSFKPNGIGDGFKGEVIDWRKEQSRKFKSEDFEFLADGTTPKYQYVITVKTGFRNWDRVAKVPTDQETGKELPASEDDGLRNVYIPHQKSSNFRDVGEAIVAAMPEADDYRDAIGGVLMGKFVEEIDTNKGNPYRKFEYRFEAPVKKDGFKSDTAEGEEPSQADHSETGVEAPF